MRFVGEGTKKKRKKNTHVGRDNWSQCGCIQSSCKYCTIGRVDVIPRTYSGAMRDKFTVNIHSHTSSSLKRNGAIQQLLHYFNRVECRYVRDNSAVLGEVRFIRATGISFLEIIKIHTSLNLRLRAALRNPLYGSNVGWAIISLSSGALTYLYHN